MGAVVCCGVYTARVCVCVCVVLPLPPNSLYPPSTLSPPSYPPIYPLFNRFAKRSPEAMANGETQGVLIPAIMTCVKVRNNLLTPINNLINNRINTY